MIKFVESCEHGSLSANILCDYLIKRSYRIMSGILILGSVIEEEYMSKTPRVKTSPLNRRIGLFITIALVFAYYGGL